MAPKTWLRLTMPMMLILAWISSCEIGNAYSAGAASILVLITIGAACIQRPIQAERPPARLPALLLLWPAGITKLTASLDGSYDVFKTGCILTALPY